MSINGRRYLTRTERRKRRLFMPIIYAIAEAIVLWLTIALILLEFDVREWDIWAIIVFTVGGVYNIAKTLHVYKRQKDYGDNG